MTVGYQQLIKVIEFWRESIHPDELQDRDVVGAVDLKSREIIDLIGPRRSGKSSILKLIVKRLGLKDNYLFINFADPIFISNNDPSIIEDLIQVFREYFNPKLEYLFFDEIQDIPHWERAIRKLRDGDKFKIFLTGSSSKLLSGELSTLLTGRHQSYRIFPLSFQEFIAFRGVVIAGKRDLVLKEKALLKHFDEYLSIGGFPEIVLTNNRELLKSYFFDIVQKDVVMRYDVRDKEVLQRMAVYLMSNAAKIASIETLKNTFKISFALASSYIEYLKEAFLIFDLQQFSYSLKAQHKALKKIYSIDTGLSNAVSFRFSEDIGRALENVVFLELLKRGYEIYYYMTAGNLEVDFLIKQGQKMEGLIQVSWSLEDKKTRQREIRALSHSMEETNINHATILTYNEEETEEIKGRVIQIMPVWKWLLSA